MKPAVVAIVASAVLRIGQSRVEKLCDVDACALAFVAIYSFKVPFPVIIITAGLIGLIGGKYRRSKFLVIRGTRSESSEISVIKIWRSPGSHQAFARSPIKVLTVSLLLWMGRCSCLPSGWSRPCAFREGIFFFSKAAMVTFGGAYAVLLTFHRKRGKYHWLSATQMLDGLGLAETTPAR